MKTLMKFSGIQKTSLIDFPKRIATTLFTPGCNLRCPFCHNWRIVLNPKPPFINERMVLQILESRKKCVDAVVVSGGEPTIHKELPRFLKKLKERNFAVKLDTNGFFPQVLKECLPYLDYVALDVKTSLEKYKLLGARDTADLLRTVEILKNSRVEYEFRATIVPGFINRDTLSKIGEVVKGGKRFAFQQFNPSDTLDKTFKTVKPYDPKLIAHFADVMKPYVEEIILRV
jgi:pyruvate formate lyase activating enzyme